MGLDMHWYKEPTPEQKTEALLKGKSILDSIEIGYFRKHYDLNDHMGKVYPPEITDFNTVELEITPYVLEHMKSFKDPHDQEALDEIINNCQEALNEGVRVWYWPWW